ncbi:S-layer homology domain-containing protein [Paenibacillus turpanensis]|uniref:S-layer homology domain-containing protein n=1 Tax=Paenibacillus turpanensis TaxID=2689078 RepID=UPI001409F5F7|nr:S-layer homology domain-containing protein [Paenibacillus turpanensis]
MKRKKAPAAAKAMLAAAVLSTTIIPSALAVETSTSGSSTTTSGSTTTSTSTSSVNGALQLTRFTDVDATHWAYRHVAKLNLLNIVKGVSADRFQPDTNVTQQDAVIIAIRMMGLEDDAEKYIDSNYVTGLDVDYGSHYVLMAREKGLINLQEEQAAMAASKDNKASWGGREASREWIAKLLVRAAGKEEDAERLENAASTFTDSSEINSSLKGYVNAAVEAKLITGFEDNTFKPQGKVTRAQIVTMFSRAQPYLDSASELSSTGVVLEISNQSMKVMGDDGKVQQFSFSLDALIYSKTGQLSPSPTSHIQPFYRVFTIGRSGVASYVEVLDDEPQLEVIEGKLVEISAVDMQATLDVNGQLETYELLSTVSVEDKEGSGLSLADLTLGSQLQLKRLPGSADGAIVKIVATKLAFNKVSSGVIMKVDRTLNKISLTARDTEKVETYSVSPSIVVTSVDPTVTDIKDLNSDDVVDFEVVDSLLTKIHVSSPRYMKLEGTLAQELAANAEIINVADSTGQLVAKFLEPNVQVEVDGLGIIGLTELQKGDFMKMLVNGTTGKIEKIVITNRNVAKVEKATIVSYDAARKMLVLMDQKSNPYVFVLTSKVSIKHDGSPIALDNFQSVFNTGLKVDLTVSNNNLISIELAGKITGTITNINKTYNSITLKTGNNETVTYNYTSGYIVDHYTKSSATIDDLAIGDTVTVTLNTTQDSITKIAMSGTYLVRTVSVIPNASKIYVQDDLYGSVQGVDVTNAVTVKFADGSRATINDIQAYEPLLIASEGRTVTTITIPDTIRGKIISTDSAKNEFIVQDSSGRNHNLTAMAGVKVNIGTTSSSSLSTLKANDRVLVVKDSSGKYTFYVASFMERNFWSYSSTSNDVKFKLQTINSTSTYTLHPKVYIHKGADSISLSSFNEDEKVNVWTIDNIVVEIEKLQ